MRPRRPSTPRLPSPCPALIATLARRYETEGEILEAIDHLISTARKHNTTVCFSSRNLHLATTVATSGVDLLHIGNDIQHIVSAQDEVVATVRGKLAAL